MRLTLANLDEANRRYFDEHKSQFAPSREQEVIVCRTCGQNPEHCPGHFSVETIKPLFAILNNGVKTVAGLEGR